MQIFSENQIRLCLVRAMVIARYDCINLYPIVKLNCRFSETFLFGATILMANLQNRRKILPIIQINEVTENQ